MDVAGYLGGKIRIHRLKPTVNNMTDGGDIELTPWTKGRCFATECPIVPDIRVKPRLKPTVNNMTDGRDIELTPRTKGRCLATKCPMAPDIREKNPDKPVL